MMKNKNKKIIVGTIICVSIVLVVLATVTFDRIIRNTVKTGTVSVDKINLLIENESGESSKEMTSFGPGDIETLKWTVKNTGTAGIYTRNILRIYWNEEVPSTAQYIYLYPANMTKEEILADFRKGDDSEHQIKLEQKEITVDDEKRLGIEYEILGDVLDGSEMTGVSKEVNYNSKYFVTSTDDNDETLDEIAFKILLSPKTSYLYEGKSLAVKVDTEAMQYTDERWRIMADC